MRITNIHGRIDPERFALVVNTTLTKKDRIELGLLLLKVAKKVKEEDGNFDKLVTNFSKSLKV